MVLFVVAFVLFADLLRLVEEAVDVALCIVQFLRDPRHAQSEIFFEHYGLGEFGVLRSNQGEEGAILILIILCICIFMLVF